MNVASAVILGISHTSVKNYCILVVKLQKMQRQGNSPQPDKEDISCLFFVVPCENEKQIAELMCVNVCTL